ncbi:Transcriptional regulator, GntR family domain / Aspartate aminotransferase [hydrothermal vent metagenome]|uniref:Transcriptional regulator, GntR family domain / Aspartate aminotransferase n=1 Tax=hydrothermal vent metagenome TaxID=652676 RepID=A0A1W1E9S6_9ZZZZ
MQHPLKRSFIREILEHTSHDTISFAGGLPDVSLFPHEALQASTIKALEEPESLQYSTSTGYTPLKEQIAKRYSEQGFPTRSENILITSGSQQGLDIISRYHHGSSVCVEVPSYLGALNLFALNQMDVDSVALGEEGIDLSAFAHSMPKNKLAYLIPDFQNPSGTCYDDAHRKEVAKILHTNDTLLIEDAPYSELYFDRAHESISQHIPTQSYHLGSFSKVLAPAFRIGWIRADTKLLEPLIAYKEAMDLHTSSITQRMVSAYLEETEHFEAHLASLRDAYQNKMHYFAKQLAIHLPSFTFTPPKGGMFIYGKLNGVDTMALVRRCLEQGVVFVPGVEFGGANDEIRFNFTHSSFREIEEGLKRLKKVLDKI